MQQQSVMVLACRGPDGVAKYDPTKHVVQRYRASVLKAAYLGRSMRVDEVNGGGSFMTLAGFSDDLAWRTITKQYFEYGDSLPHHYRSHLMHGAEILGYKHPDELFRRRWCAFYFECCDDLHLNPETEAQMDLRLSDWGREHWDLDRKPIDVGTGMRSFAERDR